MLKQLNRLSIDADGRYATASELQFLKSYLQTVDQRVETYEKLRDASEEIANQLDAHVKAAEPEFFAAASKEYLDFCLRDRNTAVRCSAAAMLIDDLDSLRNGVLCWVRTIVNSVGYGKAAKVSHKVMPEVVGQYLTPDEMQLIRPALDLSRSILTE
jgi:Phycobilisome protein